MDKELDKKLLDLTVRQINTEEAILQTQEWIAKALLAPNRPGFKTAMLATIAASEKERGKLIAERNEAVKELAKLNNEVKA